MRKIDKNKIIADRQRKAIRQVMREKGLNRNAWAIKAGFAEGTLRGFLKGSQGSMGSDKLQQLADAAGVPISRLLVDKEFATETIHGYITFGAIVVRESRPATQKEQAMLQGIDFAENAEKLVVHTTPPTIHEGCIVIFEDKETSGDFTRYLGKAVLAKVRGGPEVVKILHQGAYGKYNLSPYGVANDNSRVIENVDLEWCARFRAFVAPD